MSPSPAIPGAADGRGSCRRRRAALATVVAATLLPALLASAHGGPPLRIGVPAEPALSAVGRLALSHMREGVGFGVDWREFPDEASLRTAFAAGTIDIAVGATASGSPPEASGDCLPERLAGLRDSLIREWGGEVFVLGFAAGPSPCRRPALIVSRRVLEDLRFGILGREAARFAAGVTPADVAAVRSAAERGGERAAAAAAREATAARSKR